MFVLWPVLREFCADGFPPTLAQGWKPQVRKVEVIFLRVTNGVTTLCPSPDTDEGAWKSKCPSGTGL